MQFHQQSWQPWRPTQKKSLNDHINLEVEGISTEDQNWRYNCMIFLFIKYSEDYIHLLWHEQISSPNHNFTTKLSKILWFLFSAHSENNKLNKNCAHDLAGKINIIRQIGPLNQWI